MNNTVIAETLEGIAQLLELKGESVFKVRAYSRAAQTIEGMPVEVERLMREGRIRDVPGVGASISEKIIELVTTGKCQYYDQLRSEFPPGITRLMEIPGIGPRTAYRLGHDLGVKTVTDLERALVEGQVARLPRMGEKLAENLLRSVRSLRRKDNRIPLGLALPLVEAITGRLKQNPALRNLVPAGSLRRKLETIGDIDIMGTSSEPAAVMDQFVRLPTQIDVLVKGPTKTSIIVDGGLQVDLRLVEHEAFGSLLQHFTGSKQHNINLRERALRMGLSLSEYGITHLDTGDIVKFADEESFYAHLGLQWIPPEIREGTNELELAARNAIPRLIEDSDIRGDLHIHSDWSDGRNSMREMVLAARDRGYEYVVISDHSPGLGIARGLSIERLQRQKEEIEELRRTIDGITIFHGSEVNLRSDGTMDFPDDVLAELDVVIASIHSAMGQSQEIMTERVIRALNNPHVDIIGHLSARLLGHRPPVALDMDRVLRTAAQTGTALEINAMPDRLDLKDIYVRQARDLGVKLVINTDSHRTSDLDFMRFGVAVARRGWCEPVDILNARPAREVLAFLKERSKWPVH